MANETESRKVGEKLIVCDRSRDPDCTIYKSNSPTGANVFLGFFEKTKPVAVKRIVRSCETDLLDFQEETKLMLKLSGHPNILQYYCTEMDEHFVFIATELCAGTLQNLVEGNYNGPRVGTKREILLQITQALAYIHEKQIAHRDIKPSNIFITQSYGTAAPPRMKLADFGISTILSINEKGFPQYPTNPEGTMGWIAPELNKRSDDDQQMLDLFKVDIFALGLIFGYTLSDGGKHPFGEDPEKAQYAINNNKPMTMVMSDLKKPYSGDRYAFKLIKWMVQMDPSTRPTVEQVLKDEFFVRRNNNLLNQDFERKYLASLVNTALSLSPSTTTTITSNHGRFDMEKTQQLLEHCLSLPDLPIDNAAFVRLLNDSSVDINARTLDGWNPLQLVCANYKDNNLIDIVTPLINKGVDIHAETPNGQNFLHILCGNYQHDNLINLIRFLKENNVIKKEYFNSETKQGWNPLHYLCRNYKHKNLIELIQLMIENGTQVNTSGRMATDEMIMTAEGSTPLHILCGYYPHENLDELITFLTSSSNGSGIINAKNCEGSTPLHILCEKYQNQALLVQLVKLLIEKGANVIAKNRDGWNPLHILCKHQHINHDNLLQLIPIMTESNLDVLKAKTRERWTSLHFVCQYYRSDGEKLIDLVQLLVEKGANVNASTSDGWTPLHILCSSYIHNDLHRLIELLTDNNQDIITAETSEGLNAHYMLKYVNPNKSNFSSILHILQG